MHSNTLELLIFLTKTALYKKDLLPIISISLRKTLINRLFSTKVRQITVLNSFQISIKVMVKKINLTFLIPRILSMLIMLILTFIQNVLKRIIALYFLLFKMTFRSYSINMSSPF